MKSIKRQNLLVFSLLIFVFIPVFFANANMPMPLDDQRYVEFSGHMVYSKSLYQNHDRPLANFIEGNVTRLVHDDLYHAFVSSLIELAILILIFKKNPNTKKLKDSLIFISINMFSWLFFLGTTIFSGWYLTSLFYPSILRYHYTVNFTVFFFVITIVELLVILSELLIFTLIFKNRYSKRKILIGIIVANIISALVGIFYFI